MVYITESVMRLDKHSVQYHIVTKESTQTCMIWLEPADVVGVVISKDYLV